MSGSSALSPRRPYDPPTQRKGRNQWSWKSDFEAAIGRVCRGKMTASQLAILPEWINASDLGIDKDTPRGVVIGEIMMAGALRGELPWLELVLKHALPKAAKIDVNIGAREEAVDALLPPASIDLSRLTPEQRQTMLDLTHQAMQRSGRSIEEPTTIIDVGPGSEESGQQQEQRTEGPKVQEQEQASGPVASLPPVLRTDEAWALRAEEKE